MKIKVLLNQVKELSELKHKDADVLDLIEENKDVILLKLDNPNEEYIDALQVLSIQCLVFADNKDLSWLKDHLPFVLKKWNSLNLDENEKMKSNLYEKLLFHKMSLNCNNEDWESALVIADKLLKHYPNNQIYVDWKINIVNKINDEDLASLRKLKLISALVKFPSIIFLIGIWFFNVGDDWSKLFKFSVLFIWFLSIVIIDVMIFKRKKKMLRDFPKFCV